MYLHWQTTHSTCFLGQYCTVSVPQHLRSTYFISWKQQYVHDPQGVLSAVSSNVLGSQHGASAEQSPSTPDSLWWVFMQESLDFMVSGKALDSEPTGLKLLPPSQEHNPVFVSPGKQNHCGGRLQGGLTLTASEWQEWEAASQSYMLRNKGCTHKSVWSRKYRLLKGTKASYSPLTSPCICNVVKRLQL